MKRSILCNLQQNANLIDARFDDATFYLAMYENDAKIVCEKKARGNRT